MLYCCWLLFVAVVIHPSFCTILCCCHCRSFFFSFSFSRRTQTADRIKCSMRRSWERYGEYTTTNNIQRNDWDDFVYDAVIKNDTTLTHQYEAVRCPLSYDVFFLSQFFRRRWCDIVLGWFTARSSATGTLYKSYQNALFFFFSSFLLIFLRFFGWDSSF